MLDQLLGGDWTEPVEGCTCEATESSLLWPPLKRWKEALCSCVGEARVPMSLGLQSGWTPGTPCSPQVPGEVEVATVARVEVLSSYPGETGASTELRSSTLREKLRAGLGERRYRLWSMEGGAFC